MALVLGEVLEGLESGCTQASPEAAAPPTVSGALILVSLQLQIEPSGLPAKLGSGQEWAPEAGSVRSLGARLVPLRGQVSASLQLPHARPAVRRHSSPGPDAAWPHLWSQHAMR